MIFAAALTLQAGILFAGNESSSAPVTGESTLITLAPSVPAVATFEEFDAVVSDVAFLAPSTPAEADFTDAVPASDADVMVLAPPTPAVADFNDSTEVSTDITALIPVTPLVADFE